MDQRGRLRRLERCSTAAPRRATGDPAPSGVDWSGTFRAWQQDARFAAEGDFPAAVENYQAALALREDQPPADFEPGLAADPGERLNKWRRSGREGSVTKAWMWAAEIARRALDGRPPLAELEFDELAAWFVAHEHRLRDRAGHSQLLDLGNGEVTSLAALRYGIRKGARACRASEVAEHLRHLRDTMPPPSGAKNAQLMPQA